MKRMIFSSLFLIIAALYNIQANATNENEQKPLVQHLITKLSLVKKNLDLQFVQTAKSGRLEPIAGQRDTYLLTLNDVGTYTSYFTDRPNRITGIIPTQTLFNDWQGGKSDFEKTPPNAALESEILQSADQVNYVFELRDPVYNEKEKQITYIAKLLKHQHFNNDIKELGFTVLFIDGFTFHWNGNDTH